MYDFAHTKVDIEAIPMLLKALKDDSPRVVRYAARALGKLGPSALKYGSQTRVDKEVVWELLTAASRVDPVTHLPQAYPDCVAALVQIDPSRVSVYALIHTFIGINNWAFIKVSLQALRAINTPEALDLLQRAKVFWMPKLNKKELRIVDEITEEKR